MKRLAALFAIAAAGCANANDADHLDPAVDTARQAVTAPVCGATATGPVQGRDVSRYQGAFDWAKAGVPFGYAQVSDGTTVIDPTFAANWANMKAAGVLRGAYQFFEPAEDAVAQANLMVSKVGQLGEGDLPCAIDVEATGGQSGATIAAKVRTWLAIVEKGTGKRPIIYTGAYFWDDNVGDATFGQYPLWIPSYGTACPRLPNGWSSWLVWQYSDGGGQLDHDVFNGTLADLRALAAKDATATATATATVTNVDCTHVTGTAGAPRVRLVFDEADETKVASLMAPANESFDVPTPTGLLDEQVHTVRAYDADAPSAKPVGSPRSFTCPALPIAPDARKRSVRSLAVIEAWHLSPELDVARAPVDAIARLPWDADLEGAPRVVTTADDAESVWVIDGGVRRRVVSPASTAAWRFGEPEVWLSARLEAVPEGRAWPAAPRLVAGEGSDLLLLDSPATDVPSDVDPHASGAGGHRGNPALDAPAEASTGCTVGVPRATDGTAIACIVLACATLVAVRRRSRRSLAAGLGVVGIVSGCATTPADGDAEHVGAVTQKVDAICGGGAAASIDGIPAYPFCGNFDVWSNNGVDVRATPGAGAGWVRTEAGYGFQCFELASRYMHFKFGVSPTWPVLYASQMCTVHPAGVVVTQNPVHGDLIVFAGGTCGVAAPAGHVAVVETVTPTTVTAVQQNVATRLTWQKTCASCFLHAIANGSNDPCASAADGFFCAASSQFPGGKKGEYYDCRGGATKSKVNCTGGCEVSPPGVEDICHQAMSDGGGAGDASSPSKDAAASPSVGASDDAGTSESVEPASRPAPPRADAEESAPNDAGCSSAPHGGGAHVAWIAVVIAALAAMRRRRQYSTTG